MADSGTYSPETIARRQKIADTLLLQSVKPREIRNPIQGLGQLGEAALAGWEGYRADTEEKAARKEAIAQALQAFGGGGGGAVPNIPIAASGGMPPPTGRGDDPSVKVFESGQPGGGGFNSNDALASPAGKFDPNYADNVRNIERGIAKVESEGSGGYGAVGPTITSGARAGERPLGFVQTLSGNVGPWSKEATGTPATPQQFLNDPELQKTIARDQISKNLQQYGNVADVASMHFAGQPYAQAAGRSDQLGTTVPGYVSRVATAMRTPAAPGAASVPGNAATTGAPDPQSVARITAALNPWTPAPIATASYEMYVPLGSVRYIVLPLLSIPAIMSATPNGLTPAYCVYC